MTSDTKNKPWRNWCFTLMNYTNEDWDHLKSLTTDDCKTIVIGQELTHDGKPHLQGYIELHKAVRLTGVKKLLDPKNGKQSPVHCEPSKAGRNVNMDYCSKGKQSHKEWEEFGTEGPNYGLDAVVHKVEFTPFNQGKGKRTDWDNIYNDIVENPNFADILAKYPQYAIKYPNGIQKAIDTVLIQKNASALNKEMANLRLYPWEQDLVDELDRPADRRKIIWYVDFQGGCGKSTFAKYLLSKGNCAYFTNAKTADIAHAYHGERICLFDYTRSIEGRLNYEIIESVKNGVIFAAKYNSGLKVNATPHLVCFSNFEPDKSKLSEDRWDIRYISRKDCIEETDDTSEDTEEEREETSLPLLTDNILDDILTPLDFVPTNSNSSQKPVQLAAAVGELVPSIPQSSNDNLEKVTLKGVGEANTFKPFSISSPINVPTPKNYLADKLCKNCKRNKHDRAHNMCYQCNIRQRQ